MRKLMWFSNRSDTNRPVQLEDLDFRFKKKRDCTIRLAKTKALISCAVTVTFVFA